MNMTNKKLKTLKEIDINTSSTDGIEQTLIMATHAELYTKLQIAAREWIKHLEEFENKDY